jgi:hypothetical protein
MNLQEQISRIQSMMGIINESDFFRRRVDLRRVKRLLTTHAEQVFYETESYEQFKYELTLRGVEAVMYQDYELGWEDLPEEEEIEFVKNVSDVFDGTIKDLYKKYRK